MQLSLMPLNDWNFSAEHNSSKIYAELLAKTNGNFNLYKEVAVCLGLCIIVAGKPKFADAKQRLGWALVGLVCTALSLLLAPLFSLIFTCFGIYREIIRSFLLSKKGQPGLFIDLMHGTDMFWAIDDTKARSIINILSLIDFSLIPTKSEMEPLKTVREIIKKQLHANPIQCWKLLCHRKLSSFGYYYWEKQHKIRLGDYIKWMETGKERGIAREDLSQFISSVVNKQMPCDDLSCWEIYVGKRPMESSDEGLQLYPVLFRIHHTVGDGVALVNLLINSLTQSINFPQRTVPVIKRNVQNNLTLREKLEGPMNERPKTIAVPAQDLMCQLTTQKETTEEFKDNNISQFLSNILKTNKNEKTGRGVKDVRVLLNSCSNRDFVRKLTFAGIHCLPSNRKTMSKIVIEGIHNRYVPRMFLKGVLKMFRKLIILLQAPVSLMRQASLASDSNVLHGPKLSGEKIVAWYFEDSPEPGRLLSKIKRIRTKTGCHFSDVLFTAVSESFESYYRKRNDRPKDITVVVPSRIADQNERTVVLSSEINVGESNTKITRIINRRESNVLSNKFSVGLLRLPVASRNDELGVFNKLERVRNRTDILRSSGDQLVNYWLLDIILTLLPVGLIKNLLYKLQCSLAVSNLPGPSNHTRFGMHRMNNIVFWVPNKESTGIGLTVLSYAGKLNFGIMADKVLISSQNDLDLILTDVISSIDTMDQSNYSRF